MPLKSRASSAPPEQMSLFDWLTGWAGREAASPAPAGLNAAPDAGSTAPPAGESSAGGAPMPPVLGGARRVPGPPEAGADGSDEASGTPAATGALQHPADGAGPSSADAPQGPSPTATATPTALPRGGRSVLLDGRAVPYALRRARRRTIGFSVGPEGLSVAAPRWVGQGEIDNALREKARWILRKLDEQAERAQKMQAARVVWRDGATIPFLGEPVCLVLDPRVTGCQFRAADAMEGPAALPGVAQHTLHVGLPQHADGAQLKEAVQSWLQRQARRVFEARVAVYAQRLGVQVKQIRLSSASTRWGSASADGSIRLNWRLVHFEQPVIDYVVAHELAHLREMNHSPAFWAVVRSVMPDYTEAQGRLRHGVLPIFD